MNKKTSYGICKNGKIYCPNCRRLIKIENGKNITLCYCVNYIIIKNDK